MSPRVTSVWERSGGGSEIATVRRMRMQKNAEKIRMKKKYEDAARKNTVLASWVRTCELVPSPLAPLARGVERLGRMSKAPDVDPNFFEFYLAAQRVKVYMY